MLALLHRFLQFFLVVSQQSVNLVGGSAALAC
jgi:hypothetical protein